MNLLDRLKTLEQNILVSIQKGLVPELIKCLSDPLIKSTKIDLVYVAANRVIDANRAIDAINILGIILDHGFEISKLNGFRLLVLVYIARNLNINLMNYLIDNGAKIHIKNPSMSILEYCLMNRDYCPKELFEHFFFVDQSRVFNEFKYIIKQNCEKFMEDSKLSLSCKTSIIHKLFGGYGF